MKKQTKQDYRNAIYDTTDIFVKANRLNCRDSILAKHLDGRNYIPKSTKLIVLENIYEDIINYISDNRLDS